MCRMAFVCYFWFMRDEKAKFHETVGILVEAYLNGILASGDCEACACGNLIAHHMNIEIMEYAGNFQWFRKGEPYEPEWQSVFVTESGGKQQRIRLHEYTGEARRQIDSVGYKLQELAIIENAFEIGYRKGWFVKDRQYQGLMAVVDVLAEIHGIGLTEKESAKLLFVKA